MAATVEQGPKAGPLFVPDAYLSREITKGRGGGKFKPSARRGAGESTQGDGDIRVQDGRSIGLHHMCTRAARQRQPIEGGCAAA
jgi:hypothetical protein